MNIGPKYAEYQKVCDENRRVREWLKHIGADGRKGDVLQLSPAHANVKLVVAGQYSEGGTNYWDSPSAFNSLLIKYVHDNFAEIRTAILSEMDAREAYAKSATKDELKAALDALEAA